MIILAQRHRDKPGGVHNISPLNAHRAAGGPGTLPFATGQTLQRDTPRDAPEPD